MDKEEGKEAIRTIFRKIQSKRGGSGFKSIGNDSEEDNTSSPSSAPKFGGKLSNRKEEMNEVEMLYNKLMKANLPDETLRIVN